MKRQIHQQQKIKGRQDGNKRVFGGAIKKYIVLALCFAFAFVQTGSLLAAESAAGAGALAYADTADQLAADEAEKELFTLQQIRDLSRTYGT